MTAEKAHLLKTLLLAGLGAMLASCGGSPKDTRNMALPSYVTDHGEAATVNRYLWTASLETLDFLPVTSADPIAGLIITDWYQNPEAPDEKFKVNVYILDAAPQG